MSKKNEGDNDDIRYFGTRYIDLPEAKKAEIDRQILIDNNLVHWEFWGKPLFVILAMFECVFPHINTNEGELTARIKRLKSAGYGYE